MPKFLINKDKRKSTKSKKWIKNKEQKERKREKELAIPREEILGAPFSGQASRLAVDVWGFLTGVPRCSSFLPLSGQNSPNPEFEEDPISNCTQRIIFR